MNKLSFEISLNKSIIPVIILILLLLYNILSFENNDWLGEYTYHYILIFTSLVALLLGLSEKIKDTRSSEMQNAKRKYNMNKEKTNLQ